MSAHSLPVFPNVIHDLEATCSNHIWVCDITYIRLRDEFAYLALITDVYSRKIVGYHLGRSLKTEEALKALDMALATVADGPKPIHHSDRGCQYCSHKYVEALHSHELRISMTEVNHCAENALAERMNGILKQEYGLRNEFRNMEAAQCFVDQAVDLYNCRRPHTSLNMRTPESVYAQAA
jgi:transposase InsO family protein